MINSLPNTTALRGPECNNYHYLVMIRVYWSGFGRGCPEESLLILRHCETISRFPVDIVIIEYREIRGFRGHPWDSCYMSMYQYFNNFHEWSPWFWNYFRRYQFWCWIISLIFSKVKKLFHTFMFLLISLYFDLIGQQIIFFCVVRIRYARL